MIREFSAGGIVYRKTSSRGRSAFGRKSNNVLWLVCQHSQHKGWVFPKGFIGDHPSASSGQVESVEEAAVREVKEETGIEAKIITKIPKPAGYFYVWQGGKRFKTVYYFLMECIGGDIKDHDFEMQAVEWWDEEKVKKSLTYKGDKTAFEEALKIFEGIKN